MSQGRSIRVLPPLVTLAAAMLLQPAHGAPQSTAPHNHGTTSAAATARAVHLGMSREQLQAALGQPAEKVTTNATWAAREQWIYTTDSAVPAYYYFKFGRLTGWRNPIH